MDKASVVEGPTILILVLSVYVLTFCFWYLLEGVACYLLNLLEVHFSRPSVGFVFFVSLNNEEHMVIYVCLLLQSFSLLFHFVGIKLYTYLGHKI